MTIRRALGAAYLAWCAFRDAVALVTLALAVPPSHAPVVWVFFSLRVPWAAWAAWGLARGRPIGLRLAIAYLGVISVALFAFMVVTDPVSASWSSSVWSWAVLLLLLLPVRRGSTTPA